HSIVADLPVVSGRLPPQSDAIAFYRGRAQLRHDRRRRQVRGRKEWSLSALYWFTHGLFAGRLHFKVILERGGSDGGGYRNFEAGFLRQRQRQLGKLCFALATPQELPGRPGGSVARKESDVGEF